MRAEVRIPGVAVCTLTTSPYAQLELIPDGGPGTELLLRNPNRMFAAKVGVGVAILLYEASTPKSRDELEASLRDQGVAEPGNILDALVEGGVLTSGESVEPRTRLWFDRGWRQALLFDRAVQDVTFSDIEATRSDEGKLALIDEYATTDGLPTYYREYDGPQFPLPEPRTLTASASEVLLGRRTCRRFERGVIPDEQEIADILGWAFQPLRRIRDYAIAHASEMPMLLMLSSYTPFEFYCVLEGAHVPDGVYHYDIARHALVQLRAGQYAEELRQVAIGQVFDQVGFGGVITADPERFMWRYRYSKGLRTIFIEAGALCQRLITTAGALNWQSFMTPAVRDTPATELLGVDPRVEWPMYTIGFGRARA